jgi:CxC5 like cysteine cluster associated with KDZ transposases
MFLVVCNTNYHHNFSVKDGTRTYYDGAIPDVLQVGEHQFAEQRLIQTWIMTMLLSWYSTTIQ